jgi:predicted transcriptional regulator
MSNKETPRDRAWLAVIDLLVDAQPMKVAQIARGGNISDDTARSVLHVAEEYGLLERDSPQAHTYYSTIGPLGDVADPEYRRAIRTLIAEANQSRDHVLNTLVADQQANPKDTLSWDCDQCEAETEHEVVDETVTNTGTEYFIDTRIKCCECGYDHDVTEASPTDPRKED